jgi:hypothetical protein
MILLVIIILLITHPNLFALKGETKMTNFVLLYGGNSVPEDKSQQEKVMKAWMAWYKNLGSALVDAGNPFAQKSKTIVHGGSVNDGQNATSAHGYSIVKADTIDEAVEMAKGCPLMPGQYISVLETFPVM